MRASTCRARSRSRTTSRDARRMVGAADERGRDVPSHREVLLLPAAAARRATSSATARSAHRPSCGSRRWSAARSRSSRPTSTRSGYVVALQRREPRRPPLRRRDAQVRDGALARRRAASRSVQAIVRQGPLFFEAPTVALFEYGRDDLLGMMEVSYAPDMFIRSDYYGADEFFEIQGTRGFIWVTRLCGKLHQSTRAARSLRRRRTRDDVRASSTRRTTDRSAGRRPRSSTGCSRARTPDLAPQTAIEALQLCFAVYQASNERRPVDPAIDRRRGEPERMAAERREDAWRRRRAVPRGRAERGRASSATP